MGGAKERPSPKEESKVEGSSGELARGSLEGSRVSKGGHSGEEPEGGVTQRGTARVVPGWVPGWVGPKQIRGGRCPRDAEET